MESKDIKSMPSAELLNEYVISVMKYEEDPKDTDNKFKMLDMNAEILTRMGA